MKKASAFLCLISCLITPRAYARSTDACFTKDEVRTMAAKREAFAKAASNCLQDYWNTHLEFFAKNHYSKYFGNRNTTIDTVDKRMKVLLLTFWPDVIPAKDLRKFEMEFHLSEKIKVEKKLKEKPDSPGLSDLEKFIQKTNPASSNQSGYVLRAGENNRCGSVDKAHYHKPKIK